MYVMRASTLKKKVRRKKIRIMIYKMPRPYRWTLECLSRIIAAKLFSAI